MEREAARRYGHRIYPPEGGGTWLTDRLTLDRADSHKQSASASFWTAGLGTKAGGGGLRLILA